MCSCCLYPGDRRRELLQGLSQTLPKTLPFLYKVYISILDSMRDGSDEFFTFLVFFDSMWYE
jgi:hypothetical protein